MRSIIEWCAACWIDKDRVLAVVTLNGVSLCKGCAALFADDSESLERVKKEWKANVNRIFALRQSPVIRSTGKMEVFTPPKARWDDTLNKLKAMKLGEQLTLTPDIEDCRQFSNQLRSMVHNRKLSKVAEYGFNISDLAGKVIVSKHEIGWIDKQPFKEEWKGKKSSMPRETSVTVEKVATQSEKVTVSAPVNNSGLTQPDGVQTECMTTIFLKSGSGALRLIFGGDLFSLSKADRAFVYSLVDKLHAYRDGQQTGLAKHSQSNGEKLYPVMMTLASLEDIYQNCMGSEEEISAERAAMLAAWFRGDSAVRPPT